MKKLLMAIGAFLIIASCASKGANTVNPMTTADSYLQEISNEMKIRNEASAPLAKLLTQGIQGEISNSEFIGEYPAKLNAAQEGGSGVKELCANPPTLNGADSDVAFNAATAMLDLASDMCESENLKWLYITKMIEAVSTSNPDSLDSAFVKLDQYSKFIYDAYEKFLTNESVRTQVDASQLATFRELQSYYKVQ